MPWKMTLNFKKNPFGKVVPASEWDKNLPRDFAHNGEHYMYGAPREDEEE